MCNIYVTNEFTMQEFKVPEGYLAYQVPGTTSIILYPDTQKICRFDNVVDAKEYFPSTQLQEVKMSMSTHVVGFHPPDEKWQKMKAIWDACESAEIDIPDEVFDFFDGEPDEHGQTVGLPVTDWRDDVDQGVELKVTDIPKNVTVIRFYNSF